MTITYTDIADAIACVRALINACRPYVFKRTASGNFEISTQD